MKCLIVWILVLCSIAVVAQDSPLSAQRWDFKNLEGWNHESQDNNPKQQCKIVNGQLKIWTSKKTKERKKMLTKEKIYTTGRYKWRTYISNLGKYDQASIGSWIYCDDKHEIDFEVGYGKASERKKYNAKKNEVLAYMTTQANPYASKAVPIKTGWHIFEIDLSLVDGKYLVKWFIDGKEQFSIQQTYGTQFKFFIYCSVENLDFVGDQAATKDNYALFDYVEFKPHN